MFLRFTHKFKMAAKSGGENDLTKVAGKQFWGKVASRVCRCPLGKTICRNYSSSLRFRDKHVSVFNAEILPRWLPKVARKQFWWENDFGENLPVDSSYTLWVKNFVEIAPARSFSEINMFLCFQR